jgi:6,7-dimethyl-8-ribityllumazine synthase
MLKKVAVKKVKTYKQRLRSQSDLKEKNRVLKIAIVKSLYNKDLTDSMEKACIQELVSSGVVNKNIKLYSVPGSWELPLMVKKVVQLRKFDGIVVFGVLIKGETMHFELIAREVAKNLMKISLVNNIPITFEVLATHNLKQAKERSSGKNNKGIEAAYTVLQTIEAVNFRN